MSPVATVRQKLETFGFVLSLCSAALAAAKLYQVYRQGQRRRLREAYDRATYDLVVHITGDPTGGEWALSLVKELDPSSPGVAVAVFGDYNVGKTFLINRISGLTLPSGEIENTSGLSIKHTSAGIVWLDTAGMGAPYCQRSQAPEERYGMEHLIGELAYRLSDAQIVVVSHCSLRDQEFMNALHNWQMHENRPGKNLLIVVHNYNRLSDPKLLRRAFTADVVARFSLSEIEIPVRAHPHQPQRVWVENTDGYPVYHLLLGREGSPAGDKYNESAFSIIFQLCVARLGFNMGQDYFGTTLQVLNEDLLQKYFNSPTRLRVNQMRTKLVPADDLGGAFAMNSGSHPAKEVWAPAPMDGPRDRRTSGSVGTGNSGLAPAIGAPPPLDPHLALRDVMKHLDGLQGPAGALDFHATWDT